MEILLYCGIGTISKLIRWQTRSKWSHAAMLLDDGSVIEAWVGGVKKSPSISTLHNPGTRVDVFDFKLSDKEKCLSYLYSKVGARYDYRSIFRFLSRSSKNDPEESLFCSELIFNASLAGGLRLLDRIPARMVSPALIGLSPHLKYLRTMVTK